jgi:serine/threonine protein phosphatase PrpC
MKRKVLSPNKGKVTLKTQSSKQVPKFQRVTTRSKTLKINKNLPLALTFNITYKYKDFQNADYNQYMEDFGLIIPEFMGDKKKYLFTVFDGHGGTTTAKISMENFPQILKKSLKENPQNIEQSFINTFKKLDEKMKEYPDQGNTLTCVYLCDNVIHCANVGDSTCMLVNDKKAYKISFDHKCTEPSEMKRIEKEGGKVIDERLNDVIMISRSIGDYDQKNKGLSCIPYYKKIDINLQDNFCVMGSDGIWDCIDEELLFAIANEVLEDNSVKDKASGLCQKLIDSAVTIGSQDNICCLVVCFE